MAFLSRGRWQRSLEARDDGLDLPDGGLPTFHYALVVMRDWKAELPKLFRNERDRVGLEEREETD